MKPPLYVLDGYSLIYRSYFAFIRNPLFNPQGRNSSAVFGFFRTLFGFFNRYDPKFFAVALDSLTPTFRHEKYPEYKATRDKTPQDLHDQVPVVEEILDSLGITKIRVDGMEADDIIATLAAECGSADRECYIISGDKDLLQLVGGPVKVLLPEKGEYLELGREEVFEKLGVYPEQILDYLALIGDSADNIPGVKGIGPKTAVKLLDEYTTLEGIYENLENLPEGQKNKLEEGRDSAYMSRDLVILKKDIGLGCPVEGLELKNLEIDKTVPLLLREGMNSIVKELGRAEALEEKQKDISSTAPDYETVLTEEALDRWISKVRKKGVFAFDCETTAIDALIAEPLGFSLSVESGHACYIPVKAPDCECLPEARIKEALEGILTDPKLELVGQNIKYDYKVLKRWGIEITNIAFDTMIAAWLLESSSTYGMDGLAERYLGYRTIHFNDVVTKGECFDIVPVKRATEYAAEDADITFRLYEIFRDNLEEQNLLSLLETMDVPVIPILGNMELSGIRVERERLEEYSKELEISLAETEDEIYRLCGEIFNINSTKQLQEMLFEKRKLEPIKKTKTGYSTDNSVLEALAEEDPVPALVLRYRGMSKLKSTYVDSLPKLVNPRTGRIHTSFIQTGTATGRLSSRDPNLQNIPIKTEEGRRIRDAFVPDEGNVFISADYSQIELVVLAHLSGDPALSAAFKEGKDVHRNTAALVFGIDESEVTTDQRRMAKVINFGIMYGMSGFRLSRELGIPRKEADAFIDSYFARYAGIREFIHKTVGEAEATGYSRTMFGRHRPIPGINSANQAEKRGAERIAVNTPIQGTAADIVKLAMIGLERKLPAEVPEAELLLQVHDELIFEVPEPSVEKTEAIIREVMENAADLDVPLKVGIEHGKSWGELH